MSIRLYVEVCKKDGTANYGSVGATCGLDVEIDVATLADPTAAVAQIRAFYSLCELAMNEELSRLKAAAAPPSGGTAAAGPPPPAAVKPPAPREPVGPPRRKPAETAEYDRQEGPVDDEREDEDEEQEDNPPTDGRTLLGWARNQDTDAKGWLIKLGKKLRFPNRILDWNASQVDKAYQAFRQAHRS